MVGWVCASGRGVAAHKFGLSRVWPCSNIATGFYCFVPPSQSLLIGEKSEVGALH